MVNIVLKEAMEVECFIIFPAVAVWSAAENLERKGKLSSCFLSCRCCSDAFSLLAHRVATVIWSGGRVAVIIVVPVF